MPHLYLEPAQLTKCWECRCSAALNACNWLPVWAQLLSTTFTSRLGHRSFSSLSFWWCLLVSLISWIFAFVPMEGRKEGGPSALGDVRTQNTKLSVEMCKVGHLSQMGSKVCVRAGFCSTRAVCILQQHRGVSRLHGRGEVWKNAHRGPEENDLSTRLTPFPRPAFLKLCWWK